MEQGNIESQPQNELFKIRLTDLIDLSHPLCGLSELIDWQQLDAEIAPNFSDEGAPALPTRLVAGLIFLQHAEKLLDEAVVERWIQNPYWQHFTGENFFQHPFPCDHPAEPVGVKGLEKPVVNGCWPQRSMRGYLVEQSARQALSEWWWILPYTTA